MLPFSKATGLSWSISGEAIKAEQFIMEVRSNVSKDNLS